MKTESWVFLPILLLTASAAFAQVLEKKSVTLAAATKMAAAAQSEAAKNNWHITVTVVDEGGAIVYVGRMDRTEISAIETSEAKARTAVTYKRPTKEFEDALKSGNMAVLKLKNVIPISGGLPILVDGDVIGAIGVSGSGNPNDLRCAEAGLKAFTPQ